MKIDILDVIIVILAIVIGALLSAYQAFLAAPAAVAARPALANLPFWTALFSGRFQSWAFYYYPLLASAGVVVVFAFFGVLASATMGDVR